MASACSSSLGPDELAEADLLLDHGCGYGFRASSADGEVGLELEYAVLDAAWAGLVQADEIPSLAWSGEVLIGRDLYEGWCENSSPEPGSARRVFQRWPVVEGSIEIVGDPPVQGAGPLSARVEGLVVVRPDGERVEIGAIELNNESWGLFGAGAG